MPQQGFVNVTLPVRVVNLLDKCRMKDPKTGKEKSRTDTLLDLVELSASVNAQIAQALEAWRNQA